MQLCSLDTSGMRRTRVYVRVCTRMHTLSTSAAFTRGRVITRLSVSPSRPCLQKSSRAALFTIPSLGKRKKRKKNKKNPSSESSRSLAESARKGAFTRSDDTEARSRSTRAMRANVIRDVLEVAHFLCGTGPSGLKSQVAIPHVDEGGGGLSLATGESQVRVSANQTAEGDSSELNNRASRIFAFSAPAKIATRIAIERRGVPRVGIRIECETRRRAECQTVKRSCRRKIDPVSAVESTEKARDSRDTPRIHAFPPNRALNRVSSRDRGLVSGAAGGGGKGSS